MSTRKTTHVDGDVQVENNVVVGGDGRISGGMTVGHNLKVEGWLEARNIRGVNKGVFPTYEALVAKYSEPQDGWYAGVAVTTDGETVFEFYLAQKGRWVDMESTIDSAIEVGTLQRDVEEMKKDVAKIPSLSDAVEAMQGAVSDAEEDLDALSEEDTRLADLISAEKTAREDSDEELLARSNTYRLNDASNPKLLADYVDSEEVTGRYQAREAVPRDIRKIGLSIAYRLNGVLVIETFCGTNVNFWQQDKLWKSVWYKDLYVGGDVSAAVSNYVLAIKCSSDIRLAMNVAFTASDGAIKFNFACMNDDGSLDYWITELNYTIVLSELSVEGITELAIPSRSDDYPRVSVVLDVGRLLGEEVGNFTIGGASDSVIEGCDVKYQYVPVSLSSSSCNVYRLTEDVDERLLREFSSRQEARLCVPEPVRSSGLILQYRLSGVGVVCEQYCGAFVSLVAWKNEAEWLDYTSECRFYRDMKSDTSHYYEKVLRGVECDRMISDLSLSVSIVRSVTEEDGSVSYLATIIAGMKYGDTFVSIGTKRDYKLDEARSESYHRIVLEKYTPSDPNITVIIDVKDIYTSDYPSFSIGSWNSERGLLKTYRYVKSAENSREVNRGSVYPFCGLGTSRPSASEQVYVANYLKAVLDIRVYGADVSEGYVYQIWLLSKERTANGWGNGIRLKKLRSSDFVELESVDFKSPTALPSVRQELDKIAMSEPVWLTLEAFDKKFEFLIDGSYLESGFSGEWGSELRLGAKYHISPMCYVGIDAKAETPKYDTFTSAASNGASGLFVVGEEIVSGLHSISEGSSAEVKAIADAYRPSVVCPKFPMIKKSTLHRLHDEFGNVLHIVSSSSSRVYYSICPTQTKHNSYTSREQYAADYFYFAFLSSPNHLIKVQLPHTLGDGGYVGRKKFVFEMSNGDVLLEVEDHGGDWAVSATDLTCRLYRISGLFESAPVEGVITVDASQVTECLSFNRGSSRLSAFVQIEEYKAGHLVVAPYGSGRTAIVYLSNDYGATWRVIFRGDPSNTTDYIAPKAARLGSEHGYGAWPTPDLVVSDTPLDWAGTGNGNVHIHGVAYDKWYDRIWLCTGDGFGYENGVTGIWWTDDEGYTWNRLSTRNKTIMGSMTTQLMGIVPMEHCVLFSSDGQGDGFWRWTRSGKESELRIESCYHCGGKLSSLVLEGGRHSWSKDGRFVLASFAPDNVEQGDWMERGRIVATSNGHDFEEIYVDEFTEVADISELDDDQRSAAYQRAFETAEIGWSCDVIDCGDKLLLKADKGGYIQLDYDGADAGKVSPAFQHASMTQTSEAVEISLQSGMAGYHDVTIKIPSATTSSAGLMSATDKQAIADAPDAGKEAALVEIYRLAFPGRYQQATYNAGTKLWTMHGITDITTAQMGVIYSAIVSRATNGDGNFSYEYAGATTARALPALTRNHQGYIGASYNVSCRAAYAECQAAAILRPFMNAYNHITDASHMFRDCKALTAILDARGYITGEFNGALNGLDLSPITANTGTAQMFDASAGGGKIKVGCPVLEEVRIVGLKVSLSIASPVLSYNSLMYLADNAGTAAVTGATLTLHPDVYAKFTQGDREHTPADWQLIESTLNDKGFSIAEAIIAE